MGLLDKDDNEQLPPKPYRPAFVAPMSEEVFDTFANMVATNIETTMGIELIAAKRLTFMRWLFETKRLTGDSPRDDNREAAVPSGPLREPRQESAF